MKVAIIADIHGNYPALQSVIADIKQQENIDKIICLGDIIGVCGFPNECLTLVREECDIIIIGNHDMYPFYSNITEEVPSFERKLAHKELTESQKQWLNSQEPYEQWTDFILAHSVPTPSEALGHSNGNAGVRPRDFVEVGSKYNNKIIALGHTHEQDYQDISKFGHNVLIINPGSVGDYYQDQANYSIVNTETWDVQEISVEYDKEQVVERVKQLESEYNIRLIS